MSIKIIKCASVFFLMTGALSVFSQDASLSILKPVDTPISPWWQAQWEKGYQYNHDASFELIGKAKITAEPGHAMKKMLAEGMFPSSMNIRIAGPASATSMVLDDGANILIARTYSDINTERTLQGHVEFKNIGIVNKFLEQTGLNSISKKCISYVATFAMRSLNIPASVPVSVFKNLIRPLGEMVVEKNFDVEFDNGCMEIKPGSSLWTKLGGGNDIKGIYNLAGEFGDVFRNRLFFIWQNTDGTLSCSDGSEDVDVAYNSITGPAEVRKLAIKCPKPKDDIVLGAFQRESFALNDKLFGGKERKPGDVWEVDAAFFNTFLHPELTGRFYGRAIVQYVDNEKIFDNPKIKKGSKYEARYIKLLSNEKINGRRVDTTLEYREPGEGGFSVKTDEDTVGSIYVDAKENYLRQGQLRYKAKASARAFPNLKLAKGLLGDGDISLVLDYNCKRLPLAENN